MNSSTKHFTNYRFLFLIALICLICLPVNAREERKILCIEGVGDNKLTFEKWLERDALYIITQNEKQLTLTLKTDAEKEQFAGNFWHRRDPTPDTKANEFKEKHYHRIAYVNEHLSSEISGWRTDRGKIYILYGKPYKIEKRSSRV